MEAIPLYRGVSIYQVDGSKNWYVRIWNHDKRRYVVKATDQTSAARAREFALSHALSLLKDEPLVDREFTFSPSNGRETVASTSTVRCRCGRAARFVKADDLTPGNTFRNAETLGIRRTSVTLLAQGFQKRGLIRYRELVVIKKTDFFATQARQCRAQAERASNNADRNSWLKMAVRWEGMLRPRRDDGADGIWRDCQGRARIKTVRIRYS